jgi:hypothetical protein
MISRDFLLKMSSNEHFEAKARINNVYKFNPYRKENTTLHHYVAQQVNAVQRNI